MGQTPIVLAVLLLSAGCLGAEPDSTPAPGMPVGDGLPDSLVVWSNPPFKATETTIAVNKKGDIFYGAADGGGDFAKAPIFRSRDNGTTWTEVTPRLPNGDRAPYMITDPFVHVDADTGRLFGFTMQSTRTCGQLVWSDDDGQTWTQNPHACGNAPVYDHQSITTAKPRLLKTVAYPNIVYQCYNRVSDTPCARSLDGGLTWAAIASPFAGASLDYRDTGDQLDPFCGGLAGQLHALADGTILLPREHCGRAKLAISRDDGTTWIILTIDTEAVRNGPDPVVTSDAANTIYYSWVDAKGTLRLRWSKDLGTTWSQPRDVSAPDVTTNIPDIAAHVDGRLVFFYLATDEIPGGFMHPDFKVPRRSRPADSIVNTAVWYPYFALIDDPKAAESEIKVLQASAPGDPIVRGDCDPRNCASEYFDYQAVAVRPDGRIVAAYPDHCVDKCRDPDATYKDNTLNMSPAGYATLHLWR